MRRKFAVCFVLCVLGGVALVQYIFPVQSPTMPQKVLPYMDLPDAPVQMASAVGEVEEDGLDGGGYYVLKTYADAIAVYRVYADGTRAIVKLLQVHIPALPPYDRAELSKGIIIRNEEALLKILEDFSS